MEADELTLLQAAARRRPPAKGQGKVGPWGVLTLTSHSLSFRETEGDADAGKTDGGDAAAAGVRVPLADVAAHFVTPPSAKLICLKITADAPELGGTDVGEGAEGDEAIKKRKAGQLELVFEFTQGAGPERDSFRDLIAQLVPPLRRLKRPKLATSLVPSPAATKSTARTDDAVPTMVDEEVVSAEVAKRRAALLEGDAEARELYERLVVSGVVTAREFWHSREQMRDSEAQRVSQRQSAKEAAAEEDTGGEVKPVAESDTSVQYKLTAADIRRIFTEQPTVKKAFEEWVPLKMNEMQFWTKYFQSKYFHRGGKKGEEEAQEQEQEEDSRQRTAKGKGKEKANAATVRVKREEDLRKRLGEIDLSSDLTRSDETSLGAKMGYGVADEGATKPKDTKKLSLMQKINRHATTALGEIEREKQAGRGSEEMDIDISTSSLTAKDPITKQSPAAVDVEHMKASEARMAEATLLPELEGREDTNYVALAIQDQRRYFQNTSLVLADSSASSSSSSSSSHDAVAGQTALTEALASFRSEVETVRQSSGVQRKGPIVSRLAAANVMHELDGLCRTAADGKADQGGVYGLSSAEMKMLVEYNDRANELLRHFWRCYPLSSRALATKAAKVGAAIAELREELEGVASKKVNKGRNSTSVVAGEVLLSLTRLLTRALDHHADNK